MTIIFTTGCASFYVQLSHAQQTERCTPYFAEFGNATATYGGTILDGYIIANALVSATEGKLTEGGGTAMLMASIDLPLSFAFDTALLPISIPRDIIYLGRCVF